MAVDIGIRVGNSLGVIGSPELLQQFHRIIIEKLEEGKAGSSYPIIVAALKEDFVTSKDARQAVTELDKVRKELMRLTKEDLLPRTTYQAVGGKDIADVLIEYLSFAAENQKHAAFEQCERRSAAASVGTTIVTFENRPRADKTH